MVLLHSKTARAGTFRKLRVVSLPAIKKSTTLLTTCHSRPAPIQISSPPPSSPEDQLLQRLVRAISIDEHKYSLRSLGHYWQWVPERIGNSKALDDAISVVVSAHNNAPHGVPLTKAVDYGLYSGALKSLGVVLLDTAESRSSNTLSAETLLQMLEFRFKPPEKAYYVIHGSGLAKLLRQHGPPSPGNKLDFSIALNAHGPLIGFAHSRRYDIFLDQDEWTSLTPGSQWTIGSSNASLPDNEADVALASLETKTGLSLFLRFGSCGSITGDEQHSKEIEEIGRAVQKVIDYRTFVSTRTSKFCESNVSESYHFLDPFVCQVITYHAQAAVVFKSILRHLTTDPDVRGVLKQEILGHSQRIWLMYDYAKLNKPFAVSWVSLALTLTIDLADRDMQYWITTAANDINAAKEDDSHYMDLPTHI